MVSRLTLLIFAFHFNFRNKLTICRSISQKMCTFFVPDIFSFSVEALEHSVKVRFTTEYNVVWFIWNGSKKVIIMRRPERHDRYELAPFSPSPFNSPQRCFDDFEFCLKIDFCLYTMLYARYSLGYQT